MPAPSADVFERLAALVAIDDPAQRPSRTVDEVFTGRPMATIPVGTAADVDAAFAAARAAQADWSRRPVADRVAVVRRYRDLIAEIQAVDVDSLTPIQALAKLNEWKKRVE